MTWQVAIFIFLAHRRMRTVTNYFLLNLSVADLTMAILNGAPNFFYMLRNYWVFGEILCVVNNFVANFTVASCVFTMMAISIDRWIAVMRPLEPRMSKKVAWRAIFAIWICSAVLASPALIFSHTKTYPNGATHCMLIWPDRKTPDESIYDLTYNVILLVITYVIPMTAMAICYGTMSWELWGHTHIGEVTERQRSSMISKRKVEKMVIIKHTIILFHVSSCPNLTHSLESCPFSEFCKLGGHWGLQLLANVACRSKLTLLRCHSLPFLPFRFHRTCLVLSIQIRLMLLLLVWNMRIWIGPDWIAQLLQYVF